MMMYRSLSIQSFSYMLEVFPRHLELQIRNDSSQPCQNNSKKLVARTRNNPISAPFALPAALFFVVALGVVELTACTCVVVTTVTIGFTVLAGKVVPKIVEAGSVRADNEVRGTEFVTYCPETNVKIVFGTKTVSWDTKPTTVLGDTITGGTTLPGIVVVNVRVT